MMGRREECKGQRESEREKAYCCELLCIFVNCDHAHDRQDKKREEGGVE